jgi:hypothetical protein
MGQGFLLHAPHRALRLEALASDVGAPCRCKLAHVIRSFPNLLNEATRLPPRISLSQRALLPHVNRSGKTASLPHLKRSVSVAG